MNKDQLRKLAKHIAGDPDLSSRPNDATNNQEIADILNNDPSRKNEPLVSVDDVARARTL